jgi:hypothetical protein
MTIGGQGGAQVRAYSPLSLIAHIHPAGIKGLGSQLRAPGAVDSGVRLILVALTGGEPVFSLIKEGPEHILSIFSHV